jgi:hypothetical protein
MRLIRQGAAMKNSIKAAVTFNLLLLSSSAVCAAVRVCQPIVSSDIAIASSELAAKKKALDQWREEALKAGPGYDVWRLAAQKSLKCFKKDDGNFECVAFGAPCLIQQNPKQNPVGKSGKGVDL